MLDTGRAGNPNYEQMSPEFAQVARGDENSMGAHLTRRTS